MFLNNPFEQFIINPFFELQLFGIDISLSTVTLFFFIFGLLIYRSIFFLKDPKTKFFYLSSSTLDSFLHVFFLFIQSMLENHITVRYFQQTFFPLVFSLSAFLLLINLIGNIPFCLSLTSQVAFVCAFALPSVFGMFFWSIYARRLSFLDTFYSPGTSTGLAALLAPLEILTYIMRPLSILCRLFANFMSGHIIFKVLIGGLINLSFSIYSLSIPVSLMCSFMVLSFVLLILLELAISFIQVYVFLVIIGMFFSDSLGHHYRH